MHSLLILFVVALTSGCADVSGAPTIPPVETFVIPFEDFQNNDADDLVSVTGSQVQATSLSSPTDEQSFVPLTGDQSNFNYAAGTVLIWGAILVTNLVVPVAAFCESFEHTPVQQPDGSWIWSYSVVVAGFAYSAELHGQFITEGVHWDMRISREGEYEDFLWYYGENDLPATEGFWILKHSPAAPNDLLQIDWSRNISAGTHAVRYTNIIPDGPLNGSYIDAQYTKGTPYDHIWDLHNKSDDSHTHIEWSSSTREGRVSSPDHFGDDEWHCWDSDRMNVACL
jgi:hypothetical protein